VTKFVSVKPNVPTDISHNCVYKYGVLYSYINTRCSPLITPNSWLYCGSMAELLFHGIDQTDKAKSWNVPK